MSIVNTSTRVPWLTEKDVAHRGLFLSGSKREENSLAAIKAAVDKGFAVEIDVRITADEIAVVFHDPTLDRLTEKSGELIKYSYRQLQDINVGWTGLPMPSLLDAIDVIDGKVPLFITIKTEGLKDEAIRRVCAGIRRALEGYKGNVAVQSFDPRVIEWFRKYLPRCARGLVLGRQVILSIPNRVRLFFVMRRLQPDFVSVDVNLLPNPFADSVREKGMPIFAWTVRHVDMEEIARRHSDRVIFEEPAVTGQVSDI